MLRAIMPAMSGNGSLERSLASPIGVDENPNSTSLVSPDKKNKPISWGSVLKRLLVDFSSIPSDAEHMTPYQRTLLAFMAQDGQMDWIGARARLVLFTKDLMTIWNDPESAALFNPSVCLCERQTAIPIFERERVVLQKDCIQTVMAKSDFSIDQPSVFNAGPDGIREIRFMIEDVVPGTARGLIDTRERIREALNERCISKPEDVERAEHELAWLMNLFSTQVFITFGIATKEEDTRLPVRFHSLLALDMLRMLDGAGEEDRMVARWCRPGLLPAVQSKPMLIRTMDFGSVAPLMTFEEKLTGIYQVIAEREKANHLSPKRPPSREYYAVDGHAALDEVPSLAQLFMGGDIE